MSEPRADIEQLLAEIPPARPRPDFAEALRESFVAGFPERAAGAAEAPPRRGGVLLRGPWLAGLAVAAALVVMFVLARRDGTGPWIQPPDAELPAGFLARFNEGQELEAAGVCDVCLPQGLDLRLRPGARVAWASAPAADPVVLDLTGGEVLIRTRPDYSGPALRVRTPHDDVLVTGTILSVAVTKAFTCVCVQRGQVRVEQPGHDPIEVPGGQRYLAFAKDSEAWRQHGGGVAETLGHSAVMSPAEEAAHLAPLSEFAE